MYVRGRRSSGGISSKHQQQAAEQSHPHTPRAASKATGKAEPLASIGRAQAVAADAAGWRRRRRFVVLLLWMQSCMYVCTYMPTGINDNDKRTAHAAADLLLAVDSFFSSGEWCLTTAAGPIVPSCHRACVRAVAAS